MRFLLAYIILFCYFLCIVTTISQNPEINDQFENTTTIHNNTLNASNEYKNEDNSIIDEIKVKVENTIKENFYLDVQPSFITKVWYAVKKLLIKLFSETKVNSVLRNIGVCAVNGAMEIVSYYFPAPIIPLIASAAGMVIPFEPVVMLKQKMPVNSYRRAIKTAVDSFVGTFQKYKTNDYVDDDPYMTRRFNRRFMNINSNEIKKNKN